MGQNTVDWLTVNPLQGSGDGSVLITVPSNTGDSRNCVITVKNTQYGISRTITVSQENPKIIPPDDEIWYTSTDGESISPVYQVEISPGHYGFNPIPIGSGSDVFGANIVSNTYAYGKGIIKFDGPVTSIGNDVFYLRTTLASIYIPDSCTTIGDDAFNVCDSLTEIDLTNITSIGEYAFANCDALTTVGDISNIRSISSFTFYDCHSLEPLDLTKITTIDDYAFFGCYAFTEVNLPNCTSIGGFAFADCYSLTTVGDTSNVTSIGTFAFTGCDVLASIDLSSCRNIYGYAFQDCSSLFEVDLSTCTSIGEKAFYGCSGLAKITINNVAPSILGSKAFDATDYCPIYVPASAVNTYKTAINWSAYANRIYPINTNRNKLFSTVKKLSVAQNNVDWLTVSPLQGTGDDTLSITASDNTSGSDRTCSITVKNTQYGITKTIVVSQSVMQPNDEIWYTSTDGNTINVNTSGYQPFGGLRMRSNTYVDGKGIIKLSGTVTRIGVSVFYNNPTLETITFPDSVTNIGGMQFRNCTSLVSVYKIPNGQTTIGEYTFQNCSSLREITIPDSVTSIGNSAFCGCSSLTSVDLPENLTTLDYFAFQRCGNLTGITIPSGVTVLGNAVFEDCTSLKEVIIPANITTIRNQAFNGCSGLTSITCLRETPPYMNVDNAFLHTNDCPIYVPASAVDTYKTATNWSTYADRIFPISNKKNKLFSAVKKLSVGQNNVGWLTVNPLYGIGDGSISITVPTNTDIPRSCVITVKNAQYGLTKTISVYQNSGYEIKYTSIDEQIITPPGYFDAYIISNTYVNGQGIIEFDNIITTIGNGAFEDCTGLTSITIPNTVTTIDVDAFRGCKALTSIDGLSNVTSIGNWAFYNCSSLTSFTIPDGVTSIGNYTFGSCKSLTSITIPDSVTSIGTDAFAYCSSLTSFTIPDNITSIGSGAFVACTGLTSVDLGSCTDIGASVFASCYNLISVTIPDGVTTISDNMFYMCYSLTSITLPDSVTNINSGAFDYCSSLISINIPSSVVGIWSFAFRECTSLEHIIIPENVEDIGNMAFYKCSNLLSIIVKPNIPPALHFDIQGDDGVFVGTYCPIYVPSENEGDYKVAPVWQKYASRIQAIP